MKYEIITIMECKNDAENSSGDFTLKEYDYYSSETWYEQNGFSKNSDGQYVYYTYQIIDTSRSDSKDCINQNICHYNDSTKTNWSGAFSSPCKEKIIKKLTEGDFIIYTDAEWGKYIILNNLD